MLIALRSTANTMDNLKGHRPSVIALLSMAIVASFSFLTTHTSFDTHSPSTPMNVVGDRKKEHAQHRKLQLPDPKSVAFRAAAPLDVVDEQILKENYCCDHLNPRNSNGWSSTQALLTSLSAGFNIDARLRER